MIEGRVTFINVWTDDCDGVCDDPRDGQVIREAFHQKFGVTECDPRYMLGVQRDWSSSIRAFARAREKPNKIDKMGRTAWLSSSH